MLIDFLRRQPIAAQQGDGLAHQLLESGIVQGFGAVAEAGPDQAHGEAVAGMDQNAAGVVPHQFREATADFHRRMPVVGQGDDAPGVFAPHPQQVGDAMHQHPGLAGTRAGEHQHIGLLTVVGDDALLVGVLQALHDAAPRLRGGLAGQVLVPVRQPAAQEVRLA